MLPQSTSITLKGLLSRIHSQATLYTRMRHCGHFTSYIN
jgi:hypothetical protein